MICNSGVFAVKDNYDFSKAVKNPYAKNLRKAMDVTSISNDGENQMIILPANYHINDKEMLIQQFGDMIMLIPKERDYIIA